MTTSKGRGPVRPRRTTAEPSGRPTLSQNPSAGSLYGDGSWEGGNLTALTQPPMIPGAHPYGAVPTGGTGLMGGYTQPPNSYSAAAPPHMLGPYLPLATPPGSVGYPQLWAGGGFPLLPPHQGHPALGMMPLPTLQGPQLHGLPQFPSGLGFPPSLYPPPMPEVKKLSKRTSITSEPDESDNIKVAVRIRPLNQTEAAQRSAPAARAITSNEIQVISTGPRGASMEKSFRFHACLGPENKQPDVISMCNVPALLDAALSGYCVSILAYGQTGSGKTFTMCGPEDSIRTGSFGLNPSDGVIARSCRYLLDAVEQQSQSAETRLSCSFLEIHNEQVYDLVHWRREPLPVRWDAHKGFHVPDLAVVECRSPPDMAQIISTGVHNRSVGSHELNMESSRSHCIFTVHIEQTTAAGAVHTGKVAFVDLAGSERLKDSKSNGGMAKETSNINRSLFTLGKVISSLADARSASSVHVPYRDSKLTKLLMDSLGGNALALFIACCSPSSSAVDETLSTLQYASRAKNIVNRPVQQVDQQDGTVQLLKREIEQLKAENRLLKDTASPSIPCTPTNSGRSSHTLLHAMEAPGSPQLGSKSGTPRSQQLPPIRRLSSRDSVGSVGRDDLGTSAGTSADTAVLAEQLQAAQERLRLMQAQNEELRGEIKSLKETTRGDGGARRGGVVAEIEIINSRLGQLEANLSSSSDSLPLSNEESPKVFLQQGLAAAIGESPLKPRAEGLHGTRHEASSPSPLSACGRPLSRHERPPSAQPVSHQQMAEDGRPLAAGDRVSPNDHAAPCGDEGQTQGLDGGWPILSGSHHQDGGVLSTAGVPWDADSTEHRVQLQHGIASSAPSSPETSVTGPTARTGAIDRGEGERRNGVMVVADQELLHNLLLS